MVTLDVGMYKEANRSLLSPCTALKSKWNKNLNINPDTLNLVDQKMRNSRQLIDTGKYFLNRTLLAQVQIPKINKGEIIKLRSFFMAKGNVLWAQWQSIE